MYYYFSYFIVTDVNLTFFYDVDLRFQCSKFLVPVNVVAPLSQSVMLPLLMWILPLQMQVLGRQEALGRLRSGQPPTLEDCLAPHRISLVKFC